MIVVLLLKYKIGAFELVEAMVQLLLIGTVMSISTTLVNDQILKTKDRIEFEALYNILLLNYEESQYFKKESVICIKEGNIVTYKGKKEIFTIKVSTNFDNNCLKINAEGNWSRGGKIYFERYNWSISVGVGKSKPKIKNYET